MRFQLLTCCLMLYFTSSVLHAQIDQQKDSLLTKQDSTRLKKVLIDSVFQRKINVVSGMGWGFPMGKTNEVLSPKFSNHIGIDITTPWDYVFVYPSVDFLVFNYTQQIDDPDYAYLLDEGRSNYYILNLPIGLRKQFTKLSIYTFTGPGIGFMAEPRAKIIPEQNRIKIENSVSVSPTWRTGLGVDYQLGNFFLFAELGWLHNFRKVQNQSINVSSIFFGLKTDVSNIADKLIGLIDKEN